MSIRPLVVAPGDGPTVQGPVGGPLTFKARGEETGGALTVIENVVAPGEGPPLHTHADEDEAWYVLAGELRFKLGEEVSWAPAGTFVFAPRNVPHAFQNAGDTPARVLVIFTPSGMERFFDRFAALPDGASPREAFGRIGGDVGMDVIGPPLGDGSAPSPAGSLQGFPSPARAARRPR
jgi:quercetin dioxygenase-like cupin family protein